MAVTAAVVVLAALSGCTSSPADAVHATMTVTPRSAAADVSVSVRVSGLPPKKTVTITSSAVQLGTTWSASARFTVPADGVVNTGLPSKVGSYTGTDAMGLFEFMAPPKGSAATLENQILASTLMGRTSTVTLRAELGGQVVASATTRRLPYAPGVTVKQLRPGTDGVYGELFQPPQQAGRKPAVLVFGGSEGGLSVSGVAGQLASRGYPTLALAYFDEPGLPSTLRDIPLEYFVKALHILRSQRDVDLRHVLVFGDSRGSEAALLLGADFPTLVGGVIAGSPSSVVNSSLPSGGSSAWTLHGKQLPYVPIARFGSTTAAATIPVEKIKGPILLVCGTADTVWPSCASDTTIVKRLKAHHFAYPVTAVAYPGAGHLVGSMEAYFSATQGYYSQVGSDGLAYGGTLRAEKPAEAEAHQALLDFLAAQR